jgi:hypothetical protein
VRIGESVTPSVVGLSTADKISDAPLVQGCDDTIQLSTLLPAWAIGNVDKFNILKRSPKAWKLER